MKVKKCVKENGYYVLFIAFLLLVFPFGKVTVGILLDLWVEEELKPGNLSNGTVMSYQGTVNRIKQHPIGNRKLKTVTADHLQAYMDFLSFGSINPDGTTAKALSKGYLRLFSAVLQGGFRFAVFPKRLITFNPMQYALQRGKAQNGNRETKRKNYEVYSLPRSEEVPEGYKELSFVCLRPDGAFEAPNTVGTMCRNFSDTLMSVPQ